MLLKPCLQQEFYFSTEFHLKPHFTYNKDDIHYFFHVSWLFFHLSIGYWFILG
jgi:hypothetical protein